MALPVDQAAADRVEDTDRYTKSRDDCSRRSKRSRLLADEQNERQGNCPTPDTADQDRDRNSSDLRVAQELAVGVHEGAFSLAPPREGSSRPSLRGGKPTLGGRPAPLAAWGALAEASGMNLTGRILPTAIVTGLAALALPAIASANDYCVDTTCGGTAVNSIEDAFKLAAVSNDADRVFLGSGKTYTAQLAGGFNYSGSGPVELIGAGTNHTELTAKAGATAVLQLTGGAGSSVHDLAIKLPPNSTGGGLFLGNTARRVDVYEDTTQQTNARDGVRIVWGGTLEDSTVTMDRDTTARGVYIGGGGGTIRRSHVGGETGVATAFGPATIQRSTLTGSKYGLRALGGVTRISSSSVHLIGYYGTGIRADVDGQSTDATVFANGVTVTGPYVPDVVAVGADNAFAPSWNAHVNLTNSILRTGGGSLFAYASNLAAGHAGISASYSDYDPAYNLAKGGHAAITQANVSNVGNVGFVPGDYRLHLAAGSPLLDSGDPATAQGLDFDGNPLVADGDGDGTARRDLGAFERPAAPAGGSAGGPVADTQAPLITGFRASRSVFRIARATTPVAARTARGTRLRYVLSEPARVRVTIKRAVRRNGHTRYRRIGTLRRSGVAGANRIRFSGRIGRRALRAGRYRAVIRATDAAGNRSAARTIRLRVARG